MKYYHMAVVENRFSKIVRRVLNADISGLEEFFRTFTEVESKDDVPLFSPWHYVSNERRAESVAGTNLLVLDYDGGSDFTSMANELSSFGKAFMYTTFSHAEERPSYRVVLPLAKYITKDEIREQKANILAAFPQKGLDRSSLDVARCFFTPCAKRGAVYNARHVFRRELWDAKTTFRTPLRVENPIQDVKPVSLRERCAAVFCLTRCKSLNVEGSEPLWFNVACAMACNGFSFEEFEHVSKQRDYRERYQQKSVVRDKWTRALKAAIDQHTSFGVIINLLKKDGQYDWYMRMRDMDVR